MANHPRTTLDDSFEFISAHVAATDAQRVAMTLYSHATHALPAFVTFGRMLFMSEVEESGKTLAMTVACSQCANPMDTEGTQFALQAAMLAASNSPEMPTPTLFRDEISDITGRNGMSGGKNPIMKYLRKGYKRGATDMVSRQGTEERYSIFTPFLMTGLRPSCVPRDVRSRCIVIKMEPGKPRKYYDVRESETYAQALNASIAQTVKSRMSELASFRGMGIHPKMSNRKLEVWEPLLAIAYVIGGQYWLNLALAAFTELALDQSDSQVLTPRQQVIRDVAEIGEASGEEFIGGLVLADELRRLDNPLYAGRTVASAACLIRDSLPLDSQQRMIAGERMRGYPVSALTDAWEHEQPDTANDAEIPVEENPFECTDSTDDCTDDSSEYRV